MTPPTRYPIEPLAAALRIELHIAGRPTDDDRADNGLTALANRLGISHRWARRMLAHGLTDTQADQFAIRAGLHPASIWPQWWEDGGDDADWYTDDPALECLRPTLTLTTTSAP